MKKSFWYINVDWGNGEIETLEKCSDESRREVFREYYTKYFNYNVWCSKRATKAYYSNL